MPRVLGICLKEERLIEKELIVLLFLDWIEEKAAGSAHFPLLWTKPHRTES